MLTQQAQLLQEAMRRRNEIADIEIPYRDELIEEVRQEVSRYDEAQNPEHDIQIGLDLIAKVLMFVEAAIIVGADEFHRQRRMFYIIGDCLLIAEPEDPRDHRTWMEETGDIDSYDEAIRGFVDSTGLYAYRGSSWDLTQDDIELFYYHLPAIQEQIGINPDLEVWAGAIPGIPGTRWPGRRKLGKLRSIIV